MIETMNTVENAAPQTSVITKSMFASGKPIVLKADKKKGKRRYSRGAKAMQKEMRGLSRMSYRMAASLSDGLQEYRKRADKSAEKKKDGALKDFYKNLAEGLSKSLRVSAKVPRDAYKAFDTKSTRRELRLFARMMG